MDGESITAMVEKKELTKPKPSKYARDCTCGITFFPENYSGLITEDGK
jgi:hypothetical protein